ncbi:MAG: hypothetical protein GF334_00445 [Candidatus Altiarchaeales archaeon]|nr:hypothetical protein [Candidatus Altiarchaeales archaeon]
MRVWVRIITTDIGENMVDVFTSREEAQDSLWNYVQENWDNEGMGESIDHFEQPEALRHYFETMEGSYGIYPTELIGQPKQEEAYLTPGMCAALKYSIRSASIVDLAKTLASAGEPAKTVGEVEAVVKEVEKQLS